MDGTVFAAVILAALLHATWNALVKSGADKVTAMAALSAGQGVAGLLLAPFVGFPPMAVLWFFIGSVVLHVGYNIFLAMAYRIGDLTQVYPLARGSAPLLVMLVSILFLGEVLSSTDKVAIVLICAGIISIGLARSANVNKGAVALALTVGVFIASYTLVDGMGARESGNAISYWTWCAIAQGIVFTLGAALYKRTSPVTLVVSQPKTFVLGGLASFAAYLLVVWAITQAPIAHVAALRETSIVFALLIGSLILNESVSIRKAIGAMTTLLGTALLKLH